MEKISTKKISIFIISTMLILYVLEGVLLNPFFLWVGSPLLFAYIHALSSGYSGSKKGISAVKGFLGGSVPVLLLAHVSWALDIGGTQTGGSTSGLIFAVIPVYAFIAGLAGYLIAWVLWGTDVESNNA